MPSSLRGIPRLRRQLPLFGVEPGQQWDQLAEKYELPIIRTVDPGEGFEGKAFTGDGPAVNSGLSTASGTTYFFDFTTDSRTPSMGWLRLMLPGTCGS